MQRTSCDVLVVGAGVAGTTVALELARAGAGVVVAERGAVCSGSSGLNAGGLRQQFTQDRLDRFERGGVEAEGVWGGEGFAEGVQEVGA